jgi:hypothetical protein
MLLFTIEIQVKHLTIKLYIFISQICLDSFTTASIINSTVYPIAYHTATYVDNVIFVIGGQIDFKNTTNDIWVLDMISPSSGIKFVYFAM